MTTVGTQTLDVTKKMRELDLTQIDIPTYAERLMAKVYYSDGYTLGRDGFFHYLSTKYKRHPSRRQVAAWLSKQELQQLYAPTRKGGVSDFANPKKPWQEIAVDLIDFVNKPVGKLKYILVLIDMFSRYMYTEAVTEKTAKKVSVSLEKILKKIKDDWKGEVKSMLSDDGGEFKSETIKVLEDNNISRRVILGGHPEQNGLVERSNGKLKMVIAKNIQIKGGNWVTHLSKATEVYNQQYNRATKYMPMDAVKLNRMEQKKLRQNVKEAYLLRKYRAGEAPHKYEVGDKVRIKLAKGKLDKASTPNWSSTIHKISNVIQRRGTMAAKYNIEGKSDEYKYSRNDLQLIKETPQPIPEQEKKPLTRQQTVINRLTNGAFTRGRAQELTRVTRSRTNTPGAPPPQPRSVNPPGAPGPPPLSTLYKVGERVSVTYPQENRDYLATVNKLNRASVVVKFDVDSTLTTLPRSKFQYIRKLS